MINKLVAGSILASPAILATHAAELTPQDYNLLFIISDDLTATTISAYPEYQACPTPNIKALADRGTLFNNAFSQYPVSGPSRASFMFGYYPAATKAYGYESGRAKVGNDCPSWGQHFKDNGYYTARVSKIYHMDVPADIYYGTDGEDDSASWTERYNCQGLEADTAGFKEKLSYNGGETPYTGYPNGNPTGTGATFITAQGDSEDYKDYSDGKAADKASELIRAHKDEKFFIALGFVRPHVPFVAPKSYFDLFPYTEVILPEKYVDGASNPDQYDIPTSGKNFKTTASLNMNLDQQKKTIQGYQASVKFVDDMVGKVLTTLEEEGLADNTIVIFTSDHGYHLGEHDFWQKISLMDESAKIPLIISVPGQTPAVCDSLVELLDLYPTMNELCGLQTPSHVQGKSIKALLENPANTVRDAAFCDSGSGSNFLLRTEEFAYIQHGENSENGAQLYDIVNDPQQFTNLIDDPTYADTVADFEFKLTNKLANVRSSDLVNNSPDPLNAALTDGTNHLSTDYTGVGGSNSRTYDTWVNLENTGNHHVLLREGVNSARQKVTFKVKNDGKVRFETNGWGTESDTGAVTFGEWHHIAYTIKNNGNSTVDITIYVDGNIVKYVEATAEANVNTSTSSNVSIADRHIVSTANSKMKGLLDEARYWNVALTQSQIQTLITGTVENDGEGGVITVEAQVPVEGVNWSDIQFYYQFNDDLLDRSIYNRTLTPSTTGFPAYQDSDAYHYVPEVVSYDAVNLRDGGFAGSPEYADWSAVEAALIATGDLKVDGIDVAPVTWADTDSYDGSTAGTYTFTGTVGTPSGGYVDNIDTISYVTVSLTIDPFDSTTLTFGDTSTLDTTNGPVMVTTTESLDFGDITVKATEDGKVGVYNRPSVDGGKYTYLVSQSTNPLYGIMNENLLCIQTKTGGVSSSDAFLAADAGGATFEFNIPNKTVTEVSFNFQRVSSGWNKTDVAYTTNGGAEWHLLGTINTLYTNTSSDLITESVSYTNLNLSGVDAFRIGTRGNNNTNIIAIALDNLLIKTEDEHVLTSDPTVQLDITAGTDVDDTTPINLGEVKQRLNRTWTASTSATDTTITFHKSKNGFDSSVTNGYRLLRTTQTRATTFEIDPTVDSIIEDENFVTFSGVDLVAGAEYTMGSTDTMTPAIGIKVSQEGTTISWTVAEEIGVAYYQVVDADGNVLDTIEADNSRSYSYDELKENVEAYIVVVDESGYKQTFLPSDANLVKVAYDLVEGWNLIAITGANAKVDELGTLWAWDGASYELATSPVAGQAVWVYSPINTQAIVETERVETELKLNTGWNMVGPTVNMRVPTEAHVVYGWTDSYQTIANDGTLLQGIGYWIFKL